MIKFKEAKIQATEKYLNFDKIICRECILKYFFLSFSTIIFLWSQLYYFLSGKNNVFTT
jgi:hypothetical protein